MKWYFVALSKYGVFKGRARRREFWIFFLFNLLAMVLLAFVEAMIITGTGVEPDFDPESSVLVNLYLLFIFIPMLAVTTRRLHDIGNSGWWQLIGLIPFIGALVILLMMMTKGDEGENKYGPSPYGVKEPPKPKDESQDVVTKQDLENLLQEINKPKGSKDGQ